jgi:hypothetical protein
VGWEPPRTRQSCRKIRSRMRKRSCQGHSPPGRPLLNAVTVSPKPPPNGLSIGGALGQHSGGGLIPNPATVDGPQPGAHRVEGSCLLGEHVPKPADPPNTQGLAGVVWPQLGLVPEDSPQVEESCPLGEPVSGYWGPQQAAGHWLNARWRRGRDDRATGRRARLHWCRRPVSPDDPGYAP